MSNARKAKGTALEHLVVRKARKRGIRARRQPLSGALKEFPADVDLETFLGECKVRKVTLDAKGHRYIHLDLDWLHDLETKARKDDLAVMVFIRPGGSPRVYAYCDAEVMLDLLATVLDRHPGDADDDAADDAADDADEPDEAVDATGEIEETDE